MPEPTRTRGPRRALLVAVAALALGGGAAGVAHASTNDAGPVETGYVVVGGSEDASLDAAGPSAATRDTGATGTDRECEEKRGGGSGQSPAPSTPAPSTPAPSTPSTPDVEGRL